MTSPTIDMKNACDKLALRFVAATIGTPSGEPAMRASFGASPKAIPATPFHFLEVLDGTLIPNPGQWQHTWSIDGVLCLAKKPADPNRVDTSRQRWLPYLLHATEDAMKIGVGAQVGYEVKSALPIGWEFVEEEVGGDKYDAIRVHWQVIVYETVSLLP